MNNIYLVMREKDNVVVSIMLNKSDHTYSFVNLTKGHICKCTFPSELDAIRDLRKYPNITEILLTASPKKSVEDFITTFEKRLGK